MNDPSAPVRAVLEFSVTDDDTALALGSGDVPVLATPRLVAWLEAATCAAAAAAGHTGAGRTSVGTRVSVEHLAATGVGGRVEAVAELVDTAGRRLRFTVTATDVTATDATATDATATDATGRVVASGEVDRVVVDVEQFLARLPRR